ncbi:MAG: hypothetical protein IPH36_18075 [Saprospiraceae bacterium]|nr:hypothetical protein [Saprospiraceae bacterium]
MRERLRVVPFKTSFDFNAYAQNQQAAVKITSIHLSTFVVEGRTID